MTARAAGNTLDRGSVHARGGNDVEMGWWKRWGRGRSLSDAAREEWRAAWTAACGDPARADVGELTARLDTLALPEDEIELEREMLDGLAALVRLHAEVEAAGLPVAPTGHRVVGAEACHLSAPACLADEADGPAGRALFTASRAIFVGAGRTVAVPWHAVAAIERAHRDVVLIRRGRAPHRFRFNAYGDALCGAYVAARLVRVRGRPL